MPLRLGLDFGTATTCVATVPDLASFRPEVIPLEGGAPFQNSSVFLDAPNGARPIVSSDSQHGRCPLALFGPAEQRFAAYWKERVQAQADGVAWSSWQHVLGRERAMLLTYFKPELADHPVRRPVLVPQVRYGIYDALGQWDDVQIDLIEREVATPEPDTHDLVAATAAIIRVAVERSVTQHRARVSLLVIGMPSFGAGSDAAEAGRARDRRTEAVARSGVAHDFGTSDFRLEFLGEAQAAAVALDVVADADEAYAVVIDVGAGTTDLALLPFRRSGHGRRIAGEPVLTQSDRFAGRDLNLAVALALKVNKHFRDATDLLDGLDRRAWQLIMDQEVERIKRAIGHEEVRHTMRLAGLAAHVEGCEEYERRNRVLRRVPDWWLGQRSPALRAAVERSCRDWRNRVADFLERSAQLVHADGGTLVAVELVGGAFRFEPLRHVLDGAVRTAGLTHVPVRYRDDGGAAQTAVARGLARWAAMQ